MNMLIVVSAMRTERILESEFNKHPEVEDGWEVIARKNDYVYIGFNRELAQKIRTEREASAVSAAGLVKKRKPTQDKQC